MQRQDNFERKSDITNDLVIINHKAKSLAEVLQQQFQQDAKLSSGSVKNGLFDYSQPFCNEVDFFQTLDVLTSLKSVSEDKIRIAILTGESYFLSIMSKLTSHADIVIMNNIHPLVNEHVTHQRNCLLETNNIGSFYEMYSKNHPLDNDKKKKEDSESKMSPHAESLNKSIPSLKKHHFTFSSNYGECVKAFLSTQIVFTSFDLFDEDICKNFSECLHANNAVVTVINVSHMHGYVSNKSLRKTLPLILSHSPCPIILYSNGGIGPRHILTSNITVGLENYFRETSCLQPQTIKQGITISKLKTFIDEYDKEKGIVRQHFKDSAAMERLKTVYSSNLVSLDASSVIPPDSMETIKSIVQSHLKEHGRNKKLTTKLLSTLDDEIYYKPFKLIPTQLKKSIFSHLDAHGLFTLSCVNKDMRKLVNSDLVQNVAEISNDKQVRGQIESLLMVCFVKITDYERSHNKSNLGFRKYYYSMETRRLNILKNDIQALTDGIKRLDTENSHSNKKPVLISYMLNYFLKFDHGRYEYETKSIELEHFSSRNFYSFDFGFNISPVYLNNKHYSLIQWDSKSIVLAFIWRLVLEFRFCETDKYRALITEMASSFLSKIRCPEFRLEKIQADVRQFTKNYFDELKRSANWSLCYIWRGRAGFIKYNLDESDNPDLYYSTGDSYYMRKKINHRQFDTAKAYEMVAVSSYLHYFFPYRDRYDEARIIMECLDQFILALEAKAHPQKDIKHLNIS